jgi:hypothetical protein
MDGGMNSSLKLLENLFLVNGKLRLVENYKPWFLEVLLYIHVFLEYSVLLA